MEAEPQRLDVGAFGTETPRLVYTRQSSTASATTGPGSLSQVGGFHSDAEPLVSRSTLSRATSRLFLQVEPLYVVVPPAYRAHSGAADEPAIAAGEREMVEQPRGNRAPSDRRGTPCG